MCGRSAAQLQTIKLIRSSDLCRKKDVLKVPRASYSFPFSVIACYLAPASPDLFVLFLLNNKNKMFAKLNKKLNTDIVGFPMSGQFEVAPLSQTDDRCDAPGPVSTCHSRWLFSSSNCTTLAWKPTGNPSNKTPARLECWHHARTRIFRCRAAQAELKGHVTQWGMLEADVGSVVVGQWWGTVEVSRAFGEGIWGQHPRR